MKPTISILQPAGSKDKDEETTKRSRTPKLLKFTLVAFMLAWITMMSSCAIMIRPAGPMGYGHVYYRTSCFGPGCCGYGGYGYHGDYGYHGYHGGYGDHGDHGDHH
jgi:hypothetical protein